MYCFSRDILHYMFCCECKLDTKVRANQCPIHIPSANPEANLKTCVVIDGHGLIQALGKHHGCQTFGDYADVLMNNVTSHFRCHTTRVDVVFVEKCDLVTGGRFS